MIAEDLDGLERLSAYLAKKAESAAPERIRSSQQKGAEFMQTIMRGRTAPKRTGAMLSSFAYEADTAKTETLFGWGRFYGRLKESGHRTRGGRKKKKSSGRVNAQPHLAPSFELHKRTLVQIMVNDLQFGG